MSSVNKVTILGNLGADPEVKTFQDGGKVCNLSVATSEKWTDKQSGEKRERTEWHRVTIRSDGIIGVAEKYLRKGSKVYLEGQLETRKWQDQSGNDRYSTEVVLRPYRSQLVLLGDGGGPKNENAGTSYNDQADTRDQRDIDDEIPF